MGILKEDMRGGSILVVAGTNRPNAVSKAVGSYCVEVLQDMGYDVSLLSLEVLSDDFIGKALYGNQGKDSAFNKLSCRIEKASKLVFVVPQYNGSFPGVLKTFIDGLKVGKRDEGQLFRGKKCALVGVSRGYQGNILGLSHFSDIVSYLGMAVFPMKLYLSGIQTPIIAEYGKYMDRIKEQMGGFVTF